MWRQDGMEKCTPRRTKLQTWNFKLILNLIASNYCFKFELNFVFLWWDEFVVEKWIAYVEIVNWLMLSKSFQKCMSLQLELLIWFLTRLILKNIAWHRNDVSKSTLFTFTETYNFSLTLTCYLLNFSKNNQICCWNWKNTLALR